MCVWEGSSITNNPLPLVSPPPFSLPLALYRTKLQPFLPIARTPPLILWVPPSLLSLASPTPTPPQKSRLCALVPIYLEEPLPMSWLPRPSCPSHRLVQPSFSPLCSTPSPLAPVLPYSSQHICCCHPSVCLFLNGHKVFWHNVEMAEKLSKQEHTHTQDSSHFNAKSVAPSSELSGCLWCA